MVLRTAVLLCAIVLATEGARINKRRSKTKLKAEGTDKSNVLKADEELKSQGAREVEVLESNTTWFSRRRSRRRAAEATPDYSKAHPGYQCGLLVHKGEACIPSGRTNLGGLFSTPCAKKCQSIAGGFACNCPGWTGGCMSAFEAEDDANAPKLITIYGKIKYKDSHVSSSVRRDVKTNEWEYLVCTGAGCPTDWGFPRAAAQKNGTRTWSWKSAGKNSFLDKYKTMPKSIFHRFGWKKKKEDSNIDNIITPTGAGDFCDAGVAGKWTYDVGVVNSADIDTSLSNLFSNMGQKLIGSAMKAAVRLVKPKVEDLKAEIQRRARRALGQDKPKEDIAVGSAAEPAKMNLNTATKEQLMQAPKIGAALSAKLIDARPFGSWDEVDELKGIGPKRLASLQTSFSLSAAKPEREMERAELVGTKRR